MATRAPPWSRASAMTTRCTSYGASASSIAAASARSSGVPLIAAPGNGVADGAGVPVTEVTATPTVGDAVGLGADGLGVGVSLGIEVGRAVGVWDTVAVGVADTYLGVTRIRRLRVGTGVTVGRCVAVGTRVAVASRVGDGVADAFTMGVGSAVGVEVTGGRVAVAGLLSAGTVSGTAVGMIRTCPTSIWLGSSIWFSSTRSATDTPKDRAIRDRLSP